MSTVTTILMLPNVMEPRENIDAFNAELQEVRPGPGDVFSNISEVRPYPEDAPSDHWGGSKVPEMDVWAAALNHISGHEVLQVARQVRWVHPVLFVWADQDDEGWNNWTVRP